MTASAQLAQLAYADPPYPGCAHLYRDPHRVERRRVGPWEPVEER